MLAACLRWVLPALLGLHLPAHCPSSRSEQVFTQSHPQLTGQAAADSVRLLHSCLQPVHDRSRGSGQKSVAMSSTGGLIDLAARQGLQISDAAQQIQEPLISPVLLEAFNQAVCSSDLQSNSDLAEQYQTVRRLAFAGVTGGSFDLSEEASI